jgi:hypothetical protein
MSCYSVAEQIMLGGADYPVELRGFEPLTSAGRRVREGIAEWRRFNPNRNFLKVGCRRWLKAVFSGSAQAVADEVN